MNWLFNAEIIVAVIGAIATLITCFWSALNACRIEKQRLYFQKEIDSANALNNQLSHIKNSRFDYEFNIYKLLSSKMNKLVYTLGKYITVCENRKDETYSSKKEKYADMEECCRMFQDYLFEICAFIPKEQYAELEEFWELCLSLQAMFYADMYIKSAGNIYERAEKKYKEISEKRNIIMISLRNYLAEYMPTAYK